MPVMHTISKYELKPAISKLSVLQISCCKIQRGMVHASILKDDLNIMPHQVESQPIKSSYTDARRSVDSLS